jgi:hypothetical protein
MRLDNFRIVASRNTTLALAAFFGQFERAYPGFVPVMSEQDRRDADRDLGVAAVALGEAKDPWGASPLAGIRDPFDARAYAKEFAQRMRDERAGRAPA